nr:DNA damage-regulated autophagy modulator protein 1 [Biomphalaria glabrata]
MPSGGVRGDIIAVLHFFIPPITFTITYFISTSLDHVVKLFPYISDTGTKSPESCLFTFFLALYSLLTLLVVYTRWRIVANRNVSGRATPRLNNVAICCGFAAAFGALIVASFQETSVLIVHLVGAGMIFLFGIIYIWLQTIISYKLPFIKGYSACLCHFRFVVACLTTGSVIAFFFTGIFSYTENNKSTAIFGLSEEVIYALYISSTSLEWASVGWLCIYFVTFAAEFKHVRIGMPVIHTEPRTIGFSQMELDSISTEGSNKF